MGGNRAPLGYNRPVAVETTSGNAVILGTMGGGTSVG
jgi:hypothetical protein